VDARVELHREQETMLMTLYLPARDASFIKLIDAVPAGHRAMTLSRWSGHPDR
jgi:hypothetical protein